MATLAPDTRADIAPDFVDVTLPELYAEDRWQAPFAALRAEGGIHYFAEGRFGPYWALTTAKPIVEVESKPEIFSSENALGGITVAGRGYDHLETFEIPMPMFIAMDAPKHTAQRKTVAPSFGPTPVSDMKAEASMSTGAVLDSLPIGESFDWVDLVSMELTTQMLARLFDFPWEERRKLTYWSDVAGDIEAFHSEETRRFRLGVAYEMAAAFHALWESKKGQPPGKDLISTMMHSEAMSQMDDNEFMGNLLLLIVGGNDTTRNSMSAFAYALNKFPEQRAKLEADPSLIPNAVQELIRWQTPLAHMRRTAKEDYDLQGHHIRKGDRVAMFYLSANRDESLFPDGEAIDIARENARRHLSFGYGIHRCVGARVAELQLTSLLEEMAKRRLRVVVDAEPDFVPGCFVHGYKKMMVHLEHY